MCVISKVFDHYQPKFNPLLERTLSPKPEAMPEWAKELIREFKEAIQAARTVDRLTGQPDCEDPEKAKLEERVARLERLLESRS